MTDPLSLGQQIQVALFGLQVLERPRRTLWLPPRHLVNSLWRLLIISAWGLFIVWETISFWVFRLAHVLIWFSLSYYGWDGPAACPRLLWEPFLLVACGWSLVSGFLQRRLDRAGRLEKIDGPRLDPHHT